MNLQDELSKIYCSLVHKAGSIGIEKFGIKNEDFSLVLPWAKDHEPELFRRQEDLHAEIDRMCLDENTNDQEFKRKVIAVGKVYIQIFEAYEKDKKASSPQEEGSKGEGAPEPSSWAPPKPAQGGLL